MVSDEGGIEDDVDTQPDIVIAGYRIRVLMTGEEERESEREKKRTF